MNCILCIRLISLIFVLLHDIVSPCCRNLSRFPLFNSFWKSFIYWILITISFVCIILRTLHPDTMALINFRCCLIFLSIGVTILRVKLPLQSFWILVAHRLTNFFKTTSLFLWIKSWTFFKDLTSCLASCFT